MEAPGAQIPRTGAMRRATLGVRTRLASQEDVTPAAAWQDAAKRLNAHGRMPGVVGRDEDIQAPGWGDELHDSFLLQLLRIAFRATKVLGRNIQRAHGSQYAHDHIQGVTFLTPRSRGIMDITCCGMPTPGGSAYLLQR